MICIKIFIENLLLLFLKDYDEQVTQIVLKSVFTKNKYVNDAFHFTLFPLCVFSINMRTYIALCYSYSNSV